MCQAQATQRVQAEESRRHTVRRGKELRQRRSNGKCSFVSDWSIWNLCASATMLRHNTWERELLKRHNTLNRNYSIAILGVVTETSLIYCIHNGKFCTIKFKSLGNSWIPSLNFITTQSSFQWGLHFLLYFLYLIFTVFSPLGFGRKDWLAV